MDYQTVLWLLSLAPSVFAICCHDRGVARLGRELRPVRGVRIDGKDARGEERSRR